MKQTKKRERVRAVLAGTDCVSPAMVFDPLSVRIAESIGYELGFLAGSAASNMTVAAPDLAVMTLTEYAEQIRRITRVSDISLMVDADHGYGNSLNVMRTVEELEHAGVSALTIEDTLLPRRFGHPNTLESISIEETTAKLRAAVAARHDPALVVIARIAALKTEAAETFIERARAFAATGVDAIFVSGMTNREQAKALGAAVKLPLLTGSVPPTITRQDLSDFGFRIMLQGHQPLRAAAHALHKAYTHLYSGGDPAGLLPNLVSAEAMNDFMRMEIYRKNLNAYQQ